MIAYVELVGSNQYQVLLTDPDTSEVLERLNLSEDDYQTWKQSASSSGTEIVETLQSVPVADPVLSTQGESESSVDLSSLPPPPENKEDAQQVEEYKTTLKSARRAYSGIESTSPAPLGDNPGFDDGEMEMEDGDGLEDKLRDGADDFDGFSEVNLDKKQTDAESSADGASPTEKVSSDKSGLSEEDKKYAQTAQNSGLLNSGLAEPVPEFKLCAGDKVVNGKNNQWIVLGRDRPGGYTTGYGPGEGDTQAGSIDIVVGRMAPHPRVRNRDGSKVKVSPIFNYDVHEGRQVCDAARIYISQKTDIDRNFKIANGRIGNVIARSGVAIKSDAVRIIARDSGIKLVTQPRQLMNSQGGKSSKAPSGIDIIAGNDDAGLQPMVLGNNLVLLMREYGVVLNEVIGTVTSLIENVAKLDVALATHFHPQAFPAGVPNIPSPSLAPVCVESITKLISLDTFSAYAEKFKLEKIEKQYLSAGATQSIRSSFNNVN